LVGGTRAWIRLTGLFVILGAMAGQRWRVSSNRWAWNRQNQLRIPARVLTWLSTLAVSQYRKIAGSLDYSPRFRVGELVVVVGALVSVGRDVTREGA
jgi:hypothetical protein